VIYRAIGMRMAACVMLVGAAGLAHAVATQPSQRTLTRAVANYLSDHGDLCVGKFTWPRVVTEEDQRNNTNDAVQLPVLERLGLVESTETPAPAAGTARRYTLTDKGLQYYLRKKRVTLGAHDMPVEHDADLCVGSLTLDKVVKWSPPEPVHGHLETLVHYTYHIKSADWMADEDARKVFPVVDRIIRGQGYLLMTVNVQLKDGKWAPVLPGQ
jgi:DNA-binding PadR family transcriptional regulator